MTRKDYIKIADVLKRLNVGDANNVIDCVTLWDRIVAEFAVELKKDNPRFNATRFRDACGQVVCDEYYDDGDGEAE